MHAQRLNSSLVGLFRVVLHNTETYFIMTFSLTANCFHHEVSVLKINKKLTKLKNHNRISKLGLLFIRFYN